MIYANFKNKLISDFETKRDMLVVRENQNRLESLFGIKDKSDRLYLNILNWFEIIAIRNVEALISELCETKGVTYYRNPTSASYYDTEIEIEGQKKYINFRSQPNAMNSSSIYKMVYSIKENDVPAMIVFLLKDGLESRESVNRFESRLKKIEDVNVECVLFEDFLEMLFGYEEKIAFLEEMADFKEEMHKAIGYQVTELCSPYNLEKLKQQLDSELSSFDYDAIKQQKYANTVTGGITNNDLSKHNFAIIKNVFIDNGRYKLLLGNSDFAESYLTSEWLYKKYFSLDELDNTFIVAGFLKSIEQLLWDIIFLVGQGRDIKGVSISEENQDEIDKTLGSLQYFLSNWSNDDLFQNSFGGGKHFVMNYLKKQISDWRKQYRNGYFHKHNLNDKDKIESIRDESYFLYLLILGTIRLTPSQVARLS